VVDAIGILVEAHGGLRVEIEGVGTDEQLRIRAALHAESAADVVKGALAVAEIVFGVVGFDVLGEMIELDVAAGFGDFGVVVVLDVIGAQAGVLVENVDAAVGESGAADLALVFGFDGGDIGLARRGRGLASLRIF